MYSLNEAAVMYCANAIDESEAENNILLSCQVSKPYK
jgi:hypothetical protein